MIEKIKGALFGLAVGDALGVPVEFSTRERLKVIPITGITGYGTWNQPPGTWSDDSSLAFCLAEGLTHDYDLHLIAANFIAWRMKGYWGAHHNVFDVGNATHASITRLINGVSPELAGGLMESDNGNGSLMRILPLVFMVKDLPVEERFQKIKEVSSITHAHFRSVLSCFIYIEMALQILNNMDVEEAYNKMKKTVLAFIEDKEFNKREIAYFNRILVSDIEREEESDIHAGGYVLNTIEASLWCLLNSSTYSEAVLKAVNLGGDADTTACVTGGLAGLLYGFDDIPKDWITTIARRDDIEDLCVRLNNKIMRLE